MSAKFTTLKPVSSGEVKRFDGSVQKRKSLEDLIQESFATMHIRDRRVGSKGPLGLFRGGLIRSSAAPFKNVAKVIKSSLNLSTVLFQCRNWSNQNINICLIPEIYDLYCESRNRKM